MSGRAHRHRPKVALVIKRSQWRIQLEERHDVRLRKLVAANDRSVAPLRASHEAHEGTVEEVRAALETVGAEVVISRRAGETFDARGVELVVTVGGDGTLLSASHSVDQVPILGINSAPQHSVGFFCGARSGHALQAIELAVRGELKKTVLARMKVSVDGEVIAARVLNDALFCHTSPAATTRYTARLGDVHEQQKSSGFWIGPAAGSTAAQRSAGGRVLPLTSQKLQLVVREPYTPHGESYQLRHAMIAPGQTLVIKSKTHDAKLFFDGPETSFDVGYGQRLEFSQAPQSLVVLGLANKRKWGG